MSDNNLQNVIGDRGERFVELKLTEHVDFGNPLFRPCFLGEKWPTLDLYVELYNIQNLTPYFFAQIKTTQADFTSSGKLIVNNVNANVVQKLLQIPAPTYIFGVHEPSRRVFIRSIHLGTQKKAITRIPPEYELSLDNLIHLRDEVLNFWQSSICKPDHSKFS